MKGNFPDNKCNDFNLRAVTQKAGLHKPRAYKYFSTFYIRETPVWEISR